MSDGEGQSKESARTFLGNRGALSPALALLNALVT